MTESLPDKLRDAVEVDGDLAELALDAADRIEELRLEIDRQEALIIMLEAQSQELRAQVAI